MFLVLINLFILSIGLLLLNIYSATVPALAGSNRTSMSRQSINKRKMKKSKGWYRGGWEWGGGRKNVVMWGKGRKEGGSDTLHENKYILFIDCSPAKREIIYI